MAQQAGGICKAGSLPNVCLDGAPVISSAIEVPSVHIPTQRGCVMQVKPKGGSIMSDREASEKLGNLGQVDSEGMEDVADGEAHKLKSGNTTRPYEAGIKKVVQFTHEKLDPVHVKKSVFADLSFHFSVAGEIELLLQEKMKVEERIAHLHFLCMLCYHKEYLEVGDLCDQYDAMLKNIERGTHTWGDYKELEHLIHTNLTFRTTVIARDGVQQGVERRRIEGSQLLRKFLGARSSTVQTTTKNHVLLKIISKACLTKKQ